MTYLCDDGNAGIEIEADTPVEAAQEYVDDGDWERSPYQVDHHICNSA